MHNTKPREDVCVHAEAPDTHPLQQNAESCTQTNTTKSIALDRIYESVKFPFQWQYGKIVELTNQEKEDANHTKRYHNKLYKKSCALCGFEGTIEFRKKSNNNHSLICRECAETYVRSAKRKGIK